MNRPQSAKIGHRTQMRYSSDDFFEEFTLPKKKKNKLKVKKNDYAGNEGSRMFPKKIHQDKEQLYSELLQLKKSLNEITEENIKLKTRNSILEKENQKMTKYLESAVEKNARVNSNIHLSYGQTRATQKQNMMVTNMKKLLRDANEEITYLKQENCKIKKVTKYSKINELEIERKMMLEENRRVNMVMDKLKAEINEQQIYEREINDLKTYLEEEVAVNQELSDSNQKYIEVIEKIQEKYKNDTDKHEQKEKRFQRQIVLQKRKINELIKTADQLRKQMKKIKDQNQSKKSRPATSNPYLNQSISFDNKKELSDQKKKNKELSDQLKIVKDKLQKTESKVLEQKKVIEGQKKEESSSVKQNRQSQSQQNPQFLLEEKKNDEADEYQNDFEVEAEKQIEVKPSYQPNMKKIKQIKQLLTYRMKAQRYPYEDLESDIYTSKQTKFTCLDLQSMMKEEPFYLADDYMKFFIQHVFEKEEVDIQEEISHEIFLKKIKDVIEEFVLPEEKEEEEMLLKVAEMTSTYPSELQIAFEKIKNGPNTVSKEKMVQMFRDLQLTENYIQLIISQLSLCSIDLEHLNFHGFFERFYFEKRLPSHHGAINEEQIESSGEDKNKKSQKRQTENAQFLLENKSENAKFLIEDELSMGMGNGENYENNVISDDQCI